MSIIDKAVEFPKIIETFFAPYICQAIEWDRCHKIKFKVFDNDGNEILNVPDFPIIKVKDKHELKMFLEPYKTYLKKHGFDFNRTK